MFSPFTSIQDSKKHDTQPWLQSSRGKHVIIVSFFLATAHELIGGCVKWQTKFCPFLKGENLLKTDRTLLATWYMHSDRSGDVIHLKSPVIWFFFQLLFAGNLVLDSPWTFPTFEIDNSCSYAEYFREEPIVYYSFLPCRSWGVKVRWSLSQLH